MTKADTNADKLKFWKELLEDATECDPELLPDLFYDGTNAKRFTALLRAAEYFKLDLSRKGDSHQLLHILAEVTFSSAGRKKGALRWGVKQLNELGAHWQEIERERPGISDSKAAKEIRERYPKQYQSPASIRPRLPDARILIGARRPSLNENTLKAKVLQLKNSYRRLLRHAEILIEDFDNLPRANKRAVMKSVPELVSRIEKSLPEFFSRIKSSLEMAIERSLPPGTAGKAPVK